MVISWVKELQKAGCLDSLTSGFVITGGTANLPGISQVAEQVFNLPVRVAAPAGIGGLTDLVKGPESAAAVGLVLHGSVHTGAARSVSGRGPVSRTVRRVVGWFTEHF